MALTKKEEKKKPIDNLTYRAEKEKAQQRVADVSDKMSIKDINEYIRRYQSGEHVHEILPPGLTKEELIQLKEEAIAKGDDDKLKIIESELFLLRD